MDKEQFERWHKLGTSNVTDALDKLGLTGGCLGLAPIVQGKKIAGPAYTVHYIPCGAVKGTVGDYIDDVEPGEVVVIDNGGRTFCTVWGDLLTLMATEKGITGTVIDGVCRDVPNIRELAYPVFSKGHFMVTGKDRVEVDAVQIPVSIGGIKVCPGDIVVADDSGVAVVPKDRAEEVYKVACEVETAEEGIAALIKQGYSIKEARKQYGYHTLQRK